MKYVFIENHRAEFSIKAMCRVLRVARSGWYVWTQASSPDEPAPKTPQFPDSPAMPLSIRHSFEAKQRYGAPRLADELPEFQY